MNAVSNGLPINCWFASYHSSASKRLKSLLASSLAIGSPVLLRVHHLTPKCKPCSLECQVKKMPIHILQGTLDLMILRTLATMGPQHAYGIASRLQQVSEDALNLNQGTIYPALVRIEQRGWTRGSWSKTENGREAKYYTITKAGLEALGEETKRWRQMAGVVEKLLAEEK